MPGTEAAGIVEEVGPDIRHVQAGDRVAYACRPYGAFSQERLVPARHLVRVPAEISLRTAAALMVKGMTAEYLLHRTHRVQKGEAILVHAAAGGVGQLVCQWARALGAIVIGTAGGAEKTRLAAEAGCHHVIDYKHDDFVARVNEITGGKGVSVVYDSVGRDTFDGPLTCLAVRGHLVNFGQSSGPVPPVSLSVLSEKSLSLTRPVLFHYIDDRRELEEISGRLFDAVIRGHVTAHVNHVYALEDVAQAHADLEARRTTGAIVLIP